MNVLLVGLGGNGSKLLVSLARAALALRAMGWSPPHVVAVDPDTVSEANLARQAFAPQDVGRSKAEVLVGKVNLLYGLGWEWRVRPFQPDDLREAEVVVSALDSKRARRQVAEALEKRKVELWWVDLGNGDRYGQVLAGNGTKEAPWPHQRLPELIGEEEDEGPSCSVLESPPPAGPPGERHGGGLGRRAPLAPLEGEEAQLPGGVLRPGPGEGDPGAVAGGEG